MDAQRLGGLRIASAAVDDGLRQSGRLGVGAGAQARARTEDLPAASLRSQGGGLLDGVELRERARGVPAADRDAGPGHREAHLLGAAARRTQGRQAAGRVVEPTHVERALDLLEGLRAPRLRRRRRRRGRPVEGGVDLSLRDDGPSREAQDARTKRARTPSGALDEVRSQRLGQRRHRPAHELVRGVSLERRHDERDLLAGDHLRDRVARRDDHEARSALRGGAQRAHARLVDLLGVVDDDDRPVARAVAGAAVGRGCASSSCTTSPMGIPPLGASITATALPSTPRVHARRRTRVDLPAPRGPSSAMPPPDGIERTRSSSARAVASRPRTGQGGVSLGAPGGSPAARRSALASSSTLGHRAPISCSLARAATRASASRRSAGSSSPRLSSASTSVAPSEYTSARTVRGCPWNSSGAAYLGVRPCAAAPPSRHGAARPRSTSVPRPSAPTITFAGLRSPCSRPAR